VKICMISYSQYEYDNRVHRYGESLIRRGDSVDVICLGAKEQPSRGELNQVQLYRIQSRDYNESSPLSYLTRMLKFFWKAGVLCTRLDREKKYDIMHFHNIPDFGVFAMAFPKWRGAKVILDNHDLVPEFYQRKFNLGPDHLVIKLLRWVEKISCNFSHHVITVTTLWEKTLTGRSVSPERCTVVLNTPDPELFKRNEQALPVKSSGPFRLSYHGNLTEIFGVDLAIEAMPAVVKAFPGTRLHIYGQGKVKETLSALAAHLEVADAVVLHDPIQRHEVPEMLKQSDLGIDPKRDGVLAGEGLSSKCMEYHAMGVPSVVSAIPAATTYYSDQLVTFFEPGNSASLADKIIMLLGNPERRSAQVKETLRFSEKHHWRIYEKAYFKLLDMLTGH